MMDTYWVALQKLTGTESEHILDDQAIWLEPIKEFGMTCEIRKPMQAKISVFPQDEGLLVRGRITGTVAMPCNLCAEDATIEIDSAFDSFEPYPEQEVEFMNSKTSSKVKNQQNPEEDKTFLDNEVDNNVMRWAAHGQGIEVNLAALVWEEFSLMLPVKPLCSNDCRGVCPVCGANRKEHSCSCTQESPDPRLAVLQGLKIIKKS